MDKLRIPQLKGVCKLLHIKNISTMKKADLVSAINKELVCVANKLACLKIQRWYRKIRIEDKLCSISLEPVKYPCFAFKPISGRLNYYNLLILKDYIISTGNFTDPLSRVQYSEKDFIAMDNMDLYHRSYNKSLYNDSPYASVVKASKNKNLYIKKTENTNEILTLERILDIICQDILDYTTNNFTNENLFATSQNVYNTLNEIYMYNYIINMERLITRDHEHAIYCVSKHIDSFLRITGSVDDSKFLLFNDTIVHLDRIKEKIELIPVIT